VAVVERWNYASAVLRKLFVLGATAIICAWAIAMTAIEVGRRFDADLASIASTALLILLAAWIVALLAVAVSKLIRSAAKPS
jgi:hypothetical protein